MTAPNHRPLSPEDMQRFKRYHVNNPGWGALHIVLEDGNVKESDVQYCIESAAERGDAEGEYLARLILTMSKRQRLHLPRKF